MRDRSQNLSNFDRTLMCRAVENFYTNKNSFNDN